MSSWIFGPSETTILVDQIKQKLIQEEKFDIASLLLEKNILDDENKNKLKTLIDEKIKDFLYYHPKLKEININVDLFISEKEKLNKENEKLNQQAIDIYNQLPISSQRIQIIFDDIILNHLDRDNLLLLIDQQVIKFISNFGEEKLNDFKAAMFNYLENKSQTHLQNQKKTLLAFRVIEIINQIKDSNPQDWMIILLNKGIISYEYYDQFLKLMADSTINILSKFPEEEIRSIIDATAGYKQSADHNREKIKDLANMRKVGSVKSNLKSLEDIFKGGQTKTTKITITRPIVIPENFIKKMGAIHNDANETKYIPSDNRIHIKENYHNGQDRLKGTRNGVNNVGIWKWWNPEGKQIAEYNFRTSKGYFTLNNGTVIIFDNGFKNNSENLNSENPEYVSWIKELNLSI